MASIGNEINIGVGITVQTMVAASFDYTNTIPGQEVPPTEWCRINYDGTIYVNWDIARIVASEPMPPFNHHAATTRAMATLLLAARDNFREATLEESDRCARETAAAYNAAKAAGSV